MCGFAVVLRLASSTSDLRPLVERMTRIMRHRGPDDEGMYISHPVGMGFRRLSILDTSPLGHQPMSSDDGQVVLVFNGEIYNYLELRTQLQALGHRFRSTGDTEVLLHAYLEWGTGCVERFNGMWAFVIYDRRSNRLFGSRDRFGIKPLYRFGDGKHVVFASEIKAIRASGLYEGTPHWPTASAFLLEGRLDESSDSFYDGISQVPAATAFEVDMEGRLRHWRYWSVDTVPPVDVADPAGAFADLFEDSMRLHMRSDVPVGVHLSGGLDSTSILCAAARLRSGASSNEPLMAFSFMSREYDESQYIADTIEQAGAQLIQLHTTPDQLWSSIGRVLWYQDEPVHSMTPLIGFALMELTASKGVKVALNGQGADETIAGYGSYFKNYWHTLLNGGSALKAWSEIGSYAAAHGGSPGGLFARQLRQLIQSKLHGVDAYRTLSRRRSLGRVFETTWFTPDLCRHFRQHEPIADLGLNGTLARSIIRDPLPIYLRLEDRNSMAHSVEARVPFLDHRLVSFVLGLPADWKLRGPWNKFVLREAMRGKIPESVRVRVDKMGFPTPARQWFRDRLCDPMLDLLHSRAVRERGIYNVPSIVRDLARHRAGDIDVAVELFRVAQFEIWSELQPSREDARGAVAGVNEKEAAAI